MIFNRKSFSLIEVLIVVLILGILACFAIPMFEGMTIKARFAEMYTNVSRIEREVDVAVAENGGWPSSGQLNDFLLKINTQLKEEIGEKDGNVSSRTFWYCVDSQVTWPSPPMILLFVYKDLPGYSGYSDASLCTRKILSNNTREWIIWDNHPWAKYLNIPDADHGSSP